MKISSHRPRVAPLIATLILATALAAPAPAAAPWPAGGETFHSPDVTGTVVRHASFPGKKLPPRDLFIWLPPSYATQPERHYPVLYMHDGQCLFDSHASFSGAEWGLDENLTRLIAAGEVPETIVVGIANTPRRLTEYTPRQAVEQALASGSEMAQRLQKEAAAFGVDLAKAELSSDDYLQFIVAELKPFVDLHYRTLPGRDTTLVAGSSMGGLISLYAICEYPEVFGAAACISTHWTLGDGMVINYLKTKPLPDPAHHRIYFDFGTATLDEPYEAYQAKMDALMTAAGYAPGPHWLSRKFAGADHSERAWCTRAPVYLKFLLGPLAPTDAK